MNVIGHDAIGVEEEIEGGSRFQQGSKNIARRVGSGEVRLAIITTDGNEIGALAEIVFGGEAYTFALDRHAQSNRRNNTISLYYHRWRGRSKDRPLQWTAS